MKLVTLERFAYTPFGAFSRLAVDSFQCYTVERPWLNNKVGQSCIPEGEYELKPGRFNHGGYLAYELKGVPGRSLIKIHVGNTMDDVIGCIAPGMGLGYLNNKWGVINSRTAFDRFMDVMDGKKGMIEIVQYSPMEKESNAD